MILAAGGKQGIFEALGCDDSPEAVAFMEVYRSFSEAERDNFTIEELFLLAGMTARRFGEVLIGALMQQGADASRLLIAAAMPNVSETLIQAATERQPIMDNKGNLVGYANPDMKAIEIFGKISRMLPMPKGSSTVINIGQPEDGEDEGTAELEPMDDFLLELRSDHPQPTPRAGQDHRSAFQCQTDRVQVRGDLNMLRKIWWRIVRKLFPRYYEPLCATT